MIRIGILGDIGSGKSFIAKAFGYPVFNADYEVSKLYRKDKEIFNKLNKKLPKYILKFPIDKNEITAAILSNKNNSKKKDIEKRLIKRKNFDRKLFNKFKKLQFSFSYKKRKSHFIIKNDFKKQSVKNEIKSILKKIL